MATPAIPGQETQPPFLPPPAELPPVNLWQPKKPQHKLTAWQWAAVIVCVPIVATFTAIGAFTSAKWAFGGSAIVTLATATPAHTHKPKPQPSYDLAGYEAAIRGPQQQAFASALTKLSVDIRQPDYPAAVNDAPALANAASSWLALLQQTNPPPAYAAAKLSYITAAITGRRAARTVQKGLTTGNVIVLQRGADQIARAIGLTFHTATATPAAQQPTGS
jgi:hypothetical protein